MNSSWKPYRTLLLAILLYSLSAFSSGCSLIPSFQNTDEKENSSKMEVEKTNTEKLDNTATITGVAGAELPEDDTSSDGELEFPLSLESNTGLFTYYNQTDPTWAQELYGPSDPILTHGCGPTVLAMLVSSYTTTSINPPQAAAWAYQNGFCIPGEGSTHSIIEGGTSAFGLSAVSITQRTPEAILQALDEGKVVVALMGPGYFTNNGHFIIIIRSSEDDTVRIADPANVSNCREDWPLSFLISQLKKKAYNGGPLWAIGYPEP